MADRKFKYWAFISYSHADKEWAKWLHRRLESYRLPAKLVRHDGDSDSLPRRLAPIFRDQDELPTSADLSRAITDALASSRHLLVICSPRAAKSRWVNEEVLTFKRLGRSECIHLLIVDGVPNAGQDPATRDEECFPPAVMRRIGPDGELTDQPTEPIAADAREGKDTRNDAAMRLISGILGVGFDELKQRDMQRRQRRMLVGIASTTAIALVMAGLAVTAVLAKFDADTARASEAVASTALLKAEQAKVESERNQRAELERQLRRQTSLRLSTESRNLREEHPQRSTLLAKLAVDITRTKGEPVHPSVSQNLRDALEWIGGIPLSGSDQPIQSAAASRDGQHLVTQHSDESVRVWDLSSDQHVAQILRTDGQSIESVLALGDDGRQLVTSSANHSAVVWDLESDSPADTAFELTGHRGLIVAAALRNSGELLVTSSHDETVRVWDLSADDPVGTSVVLPGHTTDLALSRDGTRLATSMTSPLVDEKSIYVWDLASVAPDPKPIFQFDGEDLIETMTLSADGRRLAASTSDHAIRVWRLDDKDPNSSAQLLEGHEDFVYVMSWSRDARWLITGSFDNTARVWDLLEDDAPASARELRGHDQFLTAAIFNADATMAVTASADRTARVWDLASPSLGFLKDDVLFAKKILRGHESPVSKLALDSDAKRLITVGRDQAARIWDLDSDHYGSATVLGGHREGIEELRLSGDGRRLVCSSSDQSIWVWNLDDAGNDGVRLPLEKQGDFVTLALSDDGMRLVTCGERDWPNVWDLTTDPIERPLELSAGHLVVEEDQKPVPITDVALTRDGGRMISTDFIGRVCLWNLEDGDPVASLRTLEDGASILDALWSDDGGVLITRFEYDARVRDLDSDPNELRHLDYESDMIGVVAMSADGRRVATVAATPTEDFAARVWDSSDWNTPLRVLKGHRARIGALALSADGRVLVTGSDDQTARVWDLEDTNAEASSIELDGHSREITMLALSADGTRLATISLDKSMRVWDLDNQPSSSIMISGPESDIGLTRDMVISADGDRLITGSYDGKIRIWPLQLSKLLEVADRVVGRQLSEEEIAKHDLSSVLPL